MDIRPYSASPCIPKLKLPRQITFPIAIALNLWYNAISMEMFARKEKK